MRGVVPVVAVRWVCGKVAMLSSFPFLSVLKSTRAVSCWRYRVWLCIAETGGELTVMACRTCVAVVMPRVSLIGYTTVVRRCPFEQLEKLRQKTGGGRAVVSKSIGDRGISRST